MSFGGKEAGGVKGEEESISSRLHAERRAQMQGSIPQYGDQNLSQNQKSNA